MGGDRPGRLRTPRRWCARWPSTWCGSAGCHCARCSMAQDGSAVGEVTEWSGVRLRGAWSGFTARCAAGTGPIDPSRSGGWVNTRSSSSGGSTARRSGDQLREWLHERQRPNRATGGFPSSGQQERAAAAAAHAARAAGAADPDSGGRDRRGIDGLATRCRRRRPWPAPCTCTATDVVTGATKPKIPGTCDGAVSRGRAPHRDLAAMSGRHAALPAEPQAGDQRRRSFLTERSTSAREHGTDGRSIRVHGCVLHCGQRRSLRRRRSHLFLTPASGEGAGLRTAGEHRGGAS